MVASGFRGLEQPKPEEWRVLETYVLGFSARYNVDPMYFSAILDGLYSRYVNLPQGEKEADDLEVAAIPTELFLAVIERLHMLPNLPCGSAIVECINKLASRSLPARLLDIVTFYAMNDPDPKDDIWKGTNGGDPWSHGINCVRGQAAECLGTLLFADETRLAPLRPALMADRKSVV